MNNLNYVYFLNHLKLNIARKTFFFDIHVNTALLPFLKILWKLNVIRRFVKLTPKTYRIFNSWRDQYSMSTSIKIHYRGLNPIKLKVSALKLLKTRTFTSYLILNTPKGVLTHQEALQASVGGTLLCTIC